MVFVKLGSVSKVCSVKFPTHEELVPCNVIVEIQFKGRKMTSPDHFRDFTDFCVETFLVSNLTMPNQLSEKSTHNTVLLPL